MLYLGILGENFLKKVLSELKSAPLICLNARSHFKSETKTVLFEYFGQHV